MKGERIALLQAESARLEKAAARLAGALQRAAAVKLDGPLDEAADERVESLTSKFARLADLLMQRCLRLIDIVELVDEGSMLDRLNRAAKRGLSDDDRSLRAMRDLRNRIAHDYSADVMEEIFPLVLHWSPALIEAATRTRRYGDQLALRLGKEGL